MEQIIDIITLLNRYALQKINDNKDNRYFKRPMNTKDEYIYACSKTSKEWLERNQDAMRVILSIYIDGRIEIRPR